MKDVQDMTDEEYRLYRARQMAVGAYRAEGFGAFADEVERGDTTRLHRLLAEDPASAGDRPRRISVVDFQIH